MKNRQNKVGLDGALAAAALAAALVILPTTSASAVGTPTTMSFSPTSVAPGGTFDMTFTPGDTGLTDLCNFSSYGGSASNSDPGFSIVLDLTDGLTWSTKIVNPDGTGQGSFTPSSQTTPLTLTFTVPADTIEGTLDIYVSCTDGTSSHYPWTANGISQTVPGLVVSKTAPPTDPGSGGSSDGGADATSELPNTGLASDDMWLLFGLSMALFALGVGLKVSPRTRH